jgi:hypothetical protein
MYVLTKQNAAGTQTMAIQPGSTQAVALPFNPSHSLMHQIVSCNNIANH